MGRKSFKKSDLKNLRKGGNEMQAGHDWRMVGPPKLFENELEGFKFKGPGLYLSKTDTILIIPRPPNEEPTQENIWHLKQPEGTVYEMLVYGCPFENTIFSVIAKVPCRKDER